MWLAFGIAFYLFATVSVALALRSREPSGQVTYLVCAIAGFFLSGHSLLAFARTVMTS